MKRVLILPRKTSGIVDLRDEEHYILEKVSYLEDIFAYLLKNNKASALYKFCQFEEKETIPYFIEIKDKLSNGFAEFEISRVKFKDIPEDKQEKLIEKKHLDPIKEEKSKIKDELLEMLLNEWTGEVIDEPTKAENIKQLSKINNKIAKYDYKKHLTEIV